MKTYSREDLKDKKNAADLRKRYESTLKGEQKQSYDDLKDDDKTEAAYYSQNTPEVKAEKLKNRQEQIRRENSNKISDKIKTKVEELKERAAVASYGIDNYRETYDKKKKEKGSW